MSNKLYTVVVREQDKNGKMTPPQIVYDDNGEDPFITSNFNKAALFAVNLANWFKNSKTLLVYTVMELIDVQVKH